MLIAPEQFEWILFTFNIQEFILHMLVPGDGYEHSSSKNRDPSNSHQKENYLLENVSDDYD